MLRKYATPVAFPQFGKAKWRMAIAAYVRSKRITRDVPRDSHFSRSVNVLFSKSCHSKIKQSTFVEQFIYIYRLLYRCLHICLTSGLMREEHSIESVPDRYRASLDTDPGVRSAKTSASILPLPKVAALHPLPEVPYLSTGSVRSLGFRDAGPGISPKGTGW